MSKMSFARSVDPVVTLEHAITRSSVTNERDLEKERTMGRKFTIPYGLYRAHGFVNPFLAEQTGFGADDLDLLWSALEGAFQFDQSAARPAGSMAMRDVIRFEHDSPLGNAPSHKILDAVSVTRRTGIDTARSFADYDVVIDEAAIPEAVSVQRLG